MNGHRIADKFMIGVPFARAINPITKANWEGTGVEPDIKVPKEQALKIAYKMALEKSLASIKDQQVQNGVKGLIAQAQKELDDMKPPKP